MIHVQNNDWLIGEEWDKLVDEASDKYYDYLIATANRQRFEREGSYDAGFEAGVLASEAGVGRYDG